MATVFILQDHGAGPQAPHCHDCLTLELPSVILPVFGGGSDTFRETGANCFYAQQLITEPIGFLYPDNTFNFPLSSDKPQAAA
jgi:hypothetical protein